VSSSPSSWTPSLEQAGATDEEAGRGEDSRVAQPTRSPSEASSERFPVDGGGHAHPQRGHGLEGLRREERSMAAAGSRRSWWPGGPQQGRSSWQPRRGGAHAPGRMRQEGGGTSDPAWAHNCEAPGQRLRDWRRIPWPAGPAQPSRALNSRQRGPVGPQGAVAPCLAAAGHPPTPHYPLL